MHTQDNYRWSGELQRTHRIIDMLKAEDRGVGEGFPENGKMWSVSMDLSPGRAGGESEGHALQAGLQALQARFSLFP